jgi:hypothetical protein
MIKKMILNIDNNDNQPNTAHITKFIIFCATISDNYSFLLSENEIKKFDHTRIIIFVPESFFLSRNLIVAQIKFRSNSYKLL